MFIDRNYISCEHQKHQKTTENNVSFCLGNRGLDRLINSAVILNWEILKLSLNGSLPLTLLLPKRSATGENVLHLLEPRQCLVAFILFLLEKASYIHSLQVLP